MNKYAQPPLSDLARAVRRQSLRMVHRARLGHPGGDLSAADLNQDGHPDVVCIGSATANLKWYENIMGQVILLRPGIGAKISRGAD